MLKDPNAPKKSKIANLFSSTSGPTMSNRLPQIPFLRYIVIALVAVIAFLLFKPFTIVPSGHRGVKLTFGKADPVPTGEGLNFIVPMMQSIYKMPVMIERSETQSEAASKDLQRVSTTVVLNFHIDPKQAVDVYQNLGVFENVEPRIIDPAVQEAMKSITALYTAEQLVTKRPEVADRMRVALQERMKRHGLVVDEFSVTNFRFSESFDAAIEQKTVAEQQKLKAERDLDRIKVEAEQRIAQARAEAESAKLSSEAQAVGLKAQREAVTPELIELRRVEAQLRAIEKWDGRLPNVSGGAMPFIQVSPDEKK
jgi:regulator of protease activity HflC (stomatin/prohibitin superfamily)